MGFVVDRCLCRRGLEVLDGVDECFVVVGDVFDVYGEVSGVESLFFGVEFAEYEDASECLMPGFCEASSSYAETGEVGWEPCWLDDVWEVEDDFIAMGVEGG